MDTQTLAELDIEILDEDGMTGIGGGCGLLDYLRRLIFSGSTPPGCSDESGGYSGGWRSRYA